VSIVVKIQKNVARLSKQKMWQFIFEDAAYAELPAALRNPI